MPNASALSTSHQRPLLITTGEPAGIGMDIVIDVLCHKDGLPKPLFITADASAFAKRASELLAVGAIDDAPAFGVIDDGKTLFDEMMAITQKNSLAHDIFIIHTPCDDKVKAGQLNQLNAPMVERQLDLAHTLASLGVIGAIVTAPIQKSVLIDAGIRLDDGRMFSGHTEYFMQKAGCQKVVMMLANAKMRVALVTTHIPLRDVANAVTRDEVRQTVVITEQAMRTQFGIKHPKILVCGLNPHAGESGHLGDEEMTTINPVLQEFIDDGVDISLAMPADTLFTDKYLQSADAIIAMYHDQGLAPLKSHGFGDTVNITLGLPYVRTSVDHGTALDLAGTGKASASSLIQAILIARQMCS
ncbi:4-hydroxythreonine-4-phosphate dehydrogenase PdxA [Moraxella ovis]|uniref:4-hydroxythreonine-4-phosphate dehydrogenase PdxA n=1 Tax=Moraxella ovis TaxID=29433 RepID=UPI000D90C7DC|nr:4-hydroxythreonine-4-phosphate dehydrogenase PdxA [Moraxella ovis]SPX84475.1 4-hydroxythreonine-4-phosphate dehydrogenase 1 [Moraxella ovis]STZ07041.1 4-hydroxythreonine-4-phosphate dehydrogenase 1 [Moraxella ovis]